MTRYSIYAPPSYDVCAQSPPRNVYSAPVSARIFVFSPIDAAADTYERLERLGCEITVAPRPWVSPMAPSPEELIDKASGSHVLLG